MQDVCAPNDGLIQLFTFDNITTSTLNNEVDKSRYNILVITFETTLYRKIENYVKNSHFLNHDHFQFAFIYFHAQYNVDLYVTDCRMTNISNAYFSSVFVLFYSKSYFENIVFDNATNNNQPLFYFLYNFENITMKNVTIKNFSGTATGFNDVITFANFPQTVTVIEQLHTIDTTLDGKALISSVNDLQQIQIYDSVIESIDISSSDYIIDTGQIKSAIINTTTFSNIRLSDDVNTNGAVLFFNTLDMNSELDTSIQDITIDDCEIPFVVFSSVINQSPVNKTLSISNISFTNTHFDSNRALFSTKSIRLDTSLQISMTDLLFSNLTFSNTGKLIELEHQLPTYVTITNSQFIDLNAAVILIESSNTQNTNLTTLVQINDTVFDSINDKYNSLINVREGGQLDINN